MTRLHVKRTCACAANPRPGRRDPGSTISAATVTSLTFGVYAAGAIACSLLPLRVVPSDRDAGRRYGGTLKLEYSVVGARRRHVASPPATPSARRGTPAPVSGGEFARTQTRCFPSNGPIAGTDRRPTRRPVTGNNKPPAQRRIFYIAATISSAALRAGSPRPWLRSRPPNRHDGQADLRRCCYARLALSGPLASPFTFP